jgi:hypothetical protein
MPCAYSLFRGVLTAFPRGYEGGGGDQLATHTQGGLFLACWMTLLTRYQQALLCVWTAEAPPLLVWI